VFSTTFTLPGEKVKKEHENMKKMGWKLKKHPRAGCRGGGCLGEISPQKNGNKLTNITVVAAMA
jgi:hypothetical protein